MNDKRKYKSLLFGLGILLLLLLSLLLIRCGSGGKTPTLRVETPQKLSCSQSDVFTLDVSISHLGEALYPAMSTSIRFDPACLEFLGVEEGNVFVTDAETGRALPQWSCNPDQCNKTGLINVMYLDLSGGRAAFSHEGVTILLYFPTGNPLTLESILYGLSAGVMLATVMLWFLNFNRVITSDKFIYLFGRIIPALSLVLSMTLRFIPKFKAQLAGVTDAQRCIGRDVSEGSLWRRMKIAVTVLSIMITWSLENAIETADSMKSRGYGLKGRSAFSIYRFEERDRAALLFLGFCAFYLLSGAAASAFGFRYFPSLRWAPMNAFTLSFQLVYWMLCIMPVVLNAAEERTWKAIHSNM